MRKIGISLVLALVAATAAAQQSGTQSPAQESKTFCSSVDVAALVADAKNERKENQAIVVKKILQLAPYKANLEYRASIGRASIHEKEAELIYVIAGSGKIVIGGALVNEIRSNPTNLSGTAIDGGTSQNISKGDFIIVPENTAHWISEINENLVLMSLHLPRPLPGP